MCDRPNWAHDHSAKEIVKQLSDEFYFDIKYVIESPKLKPKDYDLLQVFFWGEDYYKKFKFPKNKIVKQVSSHRWEDDPTYGPCTPEQMVKKFLNDADYIICPSMKLFNLLKAFCPNLFLCQKGYSPNKFYNTTERNGEMSICWAGNIKDPVKGVQDILIPACGNEYKLNLASDMKHEDLLNFYNSNDIYAVTSRHEADPLPLIESMACGCFPVCSDVGIVPELVRHKENGYIVPERTPQAYKEAFEWCKTNLDFIREAGKKNSNEMYEKRRWEITSESYRKMYNNVLRGEIS